MHNCDFINQNQHYLVRLSPGLEQARAPDDEAETVVFGAACLYLQHFPGYQDVLGAPCTYILP